MLKTPQTSQNQDEFEGITLETVGNLKRSKLQSKQALDWYKTRLSLSLHSKP
jgi:hypothetical protein